MGKLVVGSFVSLDGVVEAPWEWASPYFEGEGKAHSLTELMGYDAFLLGRVTYEKFAASWPRIEGEAYFDRINSMPKFVATTTLTDPLNWRNATVLQGDAAHEIGRLKSQLRHGLIKYGVGGLDHTLLKHGLVDEYRFWVVPVVVGKGKRLFEGVDLGGVTLRLTDTKRFATGSVVLTYAPEWSER